MSRTPIYGPENPLPLSIMKTELVWEGKNDEYGNRRELDIAGCGFAWVPPEARWSHFRANAKNH